MNRSMRLWIRVSSLAVLAAGLGSVDPARASVIAQWTFDGDGAAFLVDSSGKGNGLDNYQAVQSSITPTGTGSSAWFNGAAGLWTHANLNLTAYRSLTIRWSQLVQTESGSIVFEHSDAAAWNSGGFCVTANGGRERAGGRLPFQLRHENCYQPNNKRRAVFPLRRSRQYDVGQHALGNQSGRRVKYLCLAGLPR